jgi:hypothetical protein
LSRTRSTVRPEPRSFDRGIFIFADWHKDLYKVLKPKSETKKALRSRKLVFILLTIRPKIRIRSDFSVMDPVSVLVNLIWGRKPCLSSHSIDRQKQPSGILPRSALRIRRRFRQSLGALQSRCYSHLRLLI